MSPFLDQEVILDVIGSEQRLPVEVLRSHIQPALPKEGAVSPPSGISASLSLAFVLGRFA